jgi:twinkle protein
MDGGHNLMTAKEIAQQLAQRTEEALRYLLPNGKKEGNEWKVGSIDGEIGKSLCVCLSGEKAGIWCDFATGQRGDLLDLWSATRRLPIGEALKEASHWLGIVPVRFVPSQPHNFKKPLSREWTYLSSSSPVTMYLLQERKLTLETLTAFKIMQKGRAIVLPYWRANELIFTKYLQLERTEGKKLIHVEKDCEPCLFGWHLIPSHARTITLCEGEIDAMSLHQYGIPALSVPFGGGTGEKHKWLQYEFDRLAMFDVINMCFDNDIEGQAATSELVERLGRHRCRIVELPYKDANACLQNAITQDQMQEIFYNARSLDPDELKRASSFADQVTNEFYPPNGCEIGIKPPWEKAVGKVLFRPAELSIWTGINGHGKSQFLGQTILHSMKQGARVCIASLELKPKRLLTRLTRQAGGIEKPTKEYISAIHTWYGDQLWIFDLVGVAKAKRLLEIFLYAHQRYGIDIFVIDSFMKLDIAEDDYKAQKAFIEQLCDFKNQYNCHVHLVVHPRKGADETQPPGKLDNKGTGAITDLADNCFSIWRNKKKEELIRLRANGKTLSPEQLEKLNESDCCWICDKQRNGDWEGKIGLWFDPSSFQYLNHEHQKPFRFVEYSNPIRGSEHE